MAYPMFPLVRHVMCINDENDVWIYIPVPCKVSYKF